MLSGPLAGAVGDAVGLSEVAVTVYGVAKWPVLALLVMGILGLLYYASPNARVTGIRWVTPGSLLALVLWVAASALFALYVANFGSYNKTYGTLGGAVTFLVWLWITNIAVLLGAELNAELERSREIEAGVAGAEEEIQLPPREEASVGGESRRCPDLSRSGGQDPGKRTRSWPRIAARAHGVATRPRARGGRAHQARDRRARGLRRARSRTPGCLPGRPRRAEHAMPPTSPQSAPAARGIPRRTRRHLATTAWPGDRATGPRSSPRASGGCLA